MSRLLNLHSLGWALALGSAALWLSGGPAAIAGLPGPSKIAQVASDDQTPAVACATAVPAPEAVAPAAVATIAPGQTEATFHLCGADDPAVDQSIAQLIGGRAFSASLTGLSDGCASLDVTVDAASTTSGLSGFTSVSVNQQSQLSVSTTDANGVSHVIAVSITSSGGVTRATVGGAA